MQSITDCCDDSSKSDNYCQVKFRNGKEMSDIGNECFTELKKKRANRLYS